MATTSITDVVAGTISAVNAGIMAVADTATAFSKAYKAEKKAEVVKLYASLSIPGVPDDAKPEEKGKAIRDIWDALTE